MIELDLGFDLDEEEQAEYDEVLREIEAGTTAVEVWPAHHVAADGSEPIPAGVIAWARYDEDALSPRSREYNECHAVIVSTSSTSALGGSEAPGFLDIVRRHDRESYAEALVLNEAREEFGAVAVGHLDVESHTYWAMCTAADVRRWFGTPNTPGRVEEFLALDVAAAGRTILGDELRDFHDWAVGDTYVVTATYVPTGKTESLHGCRDSFPYAYLRSTAGELAREVTK